MEKQNEKSEPLAAPLSAPDEAPQGKIRDLLTSNRFKLAVASALPAHLKPDRFVRVALTALTRTPKLAECDQQSFFQCLLTLSQLGLEPDGRNAHLIPFRNNKRNITECQLIVDYKGLVDLAMRSGKLSYIHADKICDRDIFEYDKGAIKTHRIDFKQDRGNAYAYYALVRNKDGTEQCEVMPLDDIKRIRLRSRAANDGPWVSDFDEMAKKTVFRRLSKWLQLSSEYRDALDADADALEETRFAQAIPIERPMISYPPAQAAAEKQREKKAPQRKEKVEKEQQRAGVVVGGKAQEIKHELSRAGAVTKVETPHADDIMKRLALGKFTWTDLMQVGRHNSWIDDDDTTIPEDKCATLLENWSVVMEKIDEYFAQEKPKKAEKIVEQNPFL